jgi:hypothetical protein
MLKLTINVLKAHHEDSKSRTIFEKNSKKFLFTFQKSQKPEVE